jgi:hypothetical protein
MRSRMTVRSRALAAAVLTLVLTSCGAAHNAQRAELPSHLPLARPSKPIGAPGASVRILAPSTDSQQRSAFTARVAVRRFVLEGLRAGTTPRAGHGHLHFILDGGRYDQPQFSGANGRAALRLAVNGYYSPGYKPTITYRHIPAGRHTLEVEVVNRNEIPTGIDATVRFTVR